MIYIIKMHHFKFTNIWKNVLLKLNHSVHTKADASVQPMGSTVPNQSVFLAVCKNRASTCLARESVCSVNRLAASIYDFPLHPPATIIKRNWNTWAQGHKSISAQEFISANKEYKCVSLFSFNLCYVVGIKSVFSYTLGHLSLHTCAEVKLSTICDLLILGYIV